MVRFPVLSLTGFIFLNLFGLLECLVMWLISVPVIKVSLPNFSNRAIGIINFERLSPNFYTDRSKAVLLLWFLTVTCSWCPYLYFGSAIMLMIYFVNFR